MGDRWKRWSGSKRILSLLFIGTALILSMTVGLRIWEQSTQKPRVLAAFQRLAEAMQKQGDSMKALLLVIQEGNIRQEGDVHISSLDTEKFGWYVQCFKQMGMTPSDIRYRLDSHQKEDVYCYEATYQIAEIGALDIESYRKKEELIVRMPQIHDSFLRMNLHDINAQYKQSLLYSILGENLVIPEVEDVFSFAPIFPRESDLEKLDMISAFLEKYNGRLTELWRQIPVKKESEAKQVLVNGFYKNCTLFRLSLPIEFVQWYIDSLLPDFMRETWQKVTWKEEEVELLLYLDDENQIRRIETVVEPEMDGTVYRTGICYNWKGEEWLLDKVQMELWIEQPSERLDFLMDVERQFEKTEQRMYVSVKQTGEKETERIRANVIMNTDSGESRVEYKVNLPLLVADGEHSMQRLEQAIEVPDQDLVDIFKLDLIGFLKFSRDFHFDLFR